MRYGETIRHFDPVSLHLAASQDHTGTTSIGSRKPGMEPCKFFLQGRCDFGSSCMRSHEARPRSHPISPPTARALVSHQGRINFPSASQETYSRTCKYFSLGTCKYGAACLNSHDIAMVDSPQKTTSRSGNLAVKQPGNQLRSQVESDCRPKVPCRNFQNGSCPFGATCRFGHELVSVGMATRTTGFRSTSALLSTISATSLPNTTGATLALLRPDAASFAPSVKPAALTALDEQDQHPTCHFFVNGVCRFGSACKLRHSSVNRVVVDASKINDKKVVSRNGALFHPTSKTVPTNEISQEFHGAIVTFQGGAEVSSLKLPSDFSSIQILGLPASATSDTVVGLLMGLGYKVSESCIQLKLLGSTGAVAEVRVEDATFARDITQKFENELGRGINGDLSLKPLLGNVASGTLANRLQMSSVSCSWYKASHAAWLRYDSHRIALSAKKKLQSHPTIMDRILEYEVEEPNRGAGQWSWTLHIGNLDPRTQARHLRELLGPSLKPSQINLSEPAHNFSDSQAAHQVEKLLRKQGEVESFQHHPTSNGSKVKATATFFDRQNAIDAVMKLHNTNIPALGNSKFFISNIISVKYNISKTITESIKCDLDKLKENIWQSGHVHFKCYPQTDPSKPFNTLRIFGDVLTSVAEAKAKLEKLLNGVVVKKEETPLWDPYFVTSSSLIYLNEICRSNKLYIHRDARKSQLLMYGGTAIAQNNVIKILVGKIESLHHLAHSISLTPELLNKAMQGGMRRIKARFGDAAKLNVSLHPKTITISGSTEHFLEAQALLLEGRDTVDSTSNQGIEDCVICWTEASDPLETKCGHVYCKDCFESQSSSAADSEGGIPMHCCSAKCSHTFSIEELKTMLSYSAFEKLLQSSFNSYIHTHPKDFQYCPTPDCPQVYRIARTGEIFTCSTCLTPICTECNVISHDGMSCEEYKDISSEGTKAFQKWKTENGAKDCPKCSTSIIKSEGCNHMQCHGCKTHICWVCMATFDDEMGLQNRQPRSGSRECYAHMTQKHGGIFDAVDRLYLGF